MGRRQSFIAVVVACTLAVVTVGLVLVAVHRSNSSPPGFVKVALPPTGKPTPHRNVAPAKVPLVNAGKAAAITLTEGPLFTAANLQVAWRAIPGCTTRPAFAATTDGGRHWKRLQPPAPFLLLINLTGPRTGDVIAATKTCKPVYYTTRDGGRTWQHGQATRGVWAEGPVGVLTPTAALTAPCGTTYRAPVALAPSTLSDAVVVCAVGVFRTTSGGTSWHPTGRIPQGQPVTATLTPSGRGVLLVNQSPGCDGMRVAITSNAGGSWRTGECLPNANAPLGVSMQANGHAILASVSGTYVTTDYGHTWNLRG